MREWKINDLISSVIKQRSKHFLFNVQVVTVQNMYYATASTISYYDTYYFFLDLVLVVSMTIESN